MNLMKLFKFYRLMFQRYLYERYVNVIYLHWLAVCVHVIIKIKE